MKYVSYRLREINDFDFFFWLSTGILQLSKENIQHFKTWNSYLFAIFVGYHYSPGFGSGSSRPTSMRIHADPDPQQWGEDTVFYLLSRANLISTSIIYRLYYLVTFFEHLEELCPLVQVVLAGLQPLELHELWVGEEVLLQQVAEVLLLSQLLAKVQGTRSWDCEQREKEVIQKRY